MRRRTRLGVHALTWVLAGLLGLVAVVQLAAYVLLPQAAQVAPRLEALASAAIGHEVRYGTLDARMVGFTPALRLHDVTLTGADGARTRLDALELRVAVLRSAWRRELRFAGVTARGLRLDARRDAAGQWWVAGIRIGAGGDSGLLDWFLTWPRARLDDATVDFQDDVTGRRQRVQAQLAWLERHGDEHRLRARVGLDGVIEGRADLTAQATDLGGALGDAHWRLGARIEGLTAAAVDAGAVNLRAPVLDGQVFLRGTGVRLDRASGQARFAAALGADPADHPPRPGSARGVWQRRADGWVLALDRAAIGDPAVPAGSVAGAGHVQITGAVVERAGGRWRAAAKEAHLSADAALWAQIVAAVPALEPIARDAPVVRVRAVRAVVDGDQRRASAQVQDFTLPVRGDRLGLAGLAGELRAAGEEATLDLNTGALDVIVPKLYSRPLRVQAPQGLGVLRRDAGVWELALPELRGNVADVSAALGLRFRFGQPRVLGISLALGAVPATAVADLLPDQPLDPEVRDWVRGALRAGQVDGMRLLLHGEPGHFFDDPLAGRFALRAPFRDVDLDYQPGDGWPVIAGLDGEFSIEQRTLGAQAGGGQLWTTEVGPGSVVLPDFKADRKTLTVQATARGDGADLLRLVRESPLRERIGSDLPGLAVRGRVDSELKLDVRFFGTDRIGVAARGQVHDAVVDVPGVQISHVSGGLTLADARLRGKDLAGRLFDGPARFDLDAGSAGGVQVDGRGQAPAPVLAQRAGLDRWVTGQARWAAAVRIADATTTIEGTVDLGDAAIGVPAPLGKLAGPPASVRFEARCCAQPDRWTLDAQGLGDARFAAELLARDDALTLDRADLALGQAPVLPAQGMTVHAKVAQLDADPWISWAAGLADGDGVGDAVAGPGNDARSAAQQAGTPAGAPPPVADASSAASPTGALDLRGIEVQADTLLLAGRALPKQRVRLTPGEPWALAFDGPALAGQASLGLRPDLTLGFDLERLHWPAKPAIAAPDVAVATGAELDPRRVPVPGGRIADLRFGEVPLGALQMTAVRTGDGLRFDRVNLEGPHGTVDLSGAWRSAPAGVRTEVRGALKARALGELLRVAGLGAGITGGRGDLAVDGYWPGGPHRIALAGANGKVTVRLADATLPDIEPGLGRLLGVLSLETIQRRLMLDFRDLFGRGFAVDDIRGEVTLADGTAATQRLRVRGPAAHLTLRGELHVPSRALDLHVNVVPQLTSSLPAAVAIGSLGIGAALFIGQRLLGDVIDEITAQDYHVTGTLDTPQVERVPASP